MLKTALFHVGTCSGYQFCTGNVSQFSRDCFLSCKGKCFNLYVLSEMNYWDTRSLCPVLL